MLNAKQGTKFYSARQPFLLFTLLPRGLGRVSRPSDWRPIGEDLTGDLKPFLLQQGPSTSYFVMRVSRYNQLD